MQGGWGSMAAGAWGATTPANNTQDEPDSPPAAPAATNAASAFGTTGTFKPNPLGNTAGSSSNAFGVTPATNSGMSLSERESALKKKEKELADKEKRLAALEKELQEAGALVKKKNWPICFPVWHHDIAGDIPERSRRVVREAYLCWWGLVVMLTWQFFCATVVLGYKKGNAIPSWFLTIIFWICGVPLSMWLWYKRIYHAARDDSAMGYVAFFLFFVCHFAWCVFCAVGLQINAAQWCWSGFIAGFVLLDDTNFGGIIYCVGGAAWAVLAAYSLWVLKDAWFFFRGQGGVREVQQQAAQQAALAAFKEKQGSTNRV